MSGVGTTVVLLGIEREGFSMFDKLLRELKKLERGVTVTVSLEPDADGFLDRRCPAEQCSSDFKVLDEHWREKVPDERAWCPFCGGQNSPNDFTTQAQEDYAKRAAYAHVEKVLHRGLKETAQDFNRRQPRNSFLTMRMDVRSSAPVHPLPPEAAELMRTEFTCPACSCRYRIVGSAYFCPACGHSSAEQTFEQSLARVRKTVDLFAELGASLDRDDAAILRTQLLEGGLADLVTAFQRIAEVIFPRLPNAANVRLRRNVFQSLTEGSATWRDGGGRAFDAIMTVDELAEMGKLFQQRHLLEHREGFVDQPYIDRSGDTEYAVGARLVIRETSVRRLADLVEKLTRGLREDLP
jgi:hypothetical protein